jgi:hypothetical protein
MKQFIDSICEQVQQAIEIDFEGKKGLNLIKIGRNESFFMITEDILNLVIQMHTRFYIWCDQPIKSAIIQLFPYVCTHLR